MWTRFMDMHSGGGQKEAFAHCFIEAAQKEAEVIFYNRFGHNPNRVTCTCCGEDYSIDEAESLEQATAYYRNCAFAYFKNGKRIPESEGWVRGEGMQDGVTSKYIEEANPIYGHSRYIPLEKYLLQDDILVIYAKDIKPEERTGALPEQGYVWID